MMAYMEKIWMISITSYSCIFHKKLIYVSHLLLLLLLLFYLHGKFKKTNLFFNQISQENQMSICYIYTAMNGNVFFLFLCTDDNVVKTIKFTQRR